MAPLVPVTVYERAREQERIAWMIDAPGHAHFAKQHRLARRALHKCVTNKAYGKARAERGY